MANAVVTVLEADGVTETDVTVLDVGRQAAAASKSVVLGTEDKAVIDAIETATEAVAALIDTGALVVKLDPTTVNANGREAAADSAPVVLSTEDKTALDGIGVSGDSAATAGSTGTLSAKLRLVTSQLNSLVKPLAGHYEHVAASQTDQMMGATGAAGDYLAGVLIIPATTSPGEVSIEDGATNRVIFTGGASSVSNLVPFFVPLGIYSVSGGWEITTGANVSCIGVGSFT